MTRVSAAGAHPFVDGVSPGWASSWGEDRCGVWAAFEIRGVPAVMRWIPPGSFMMGSPEDEPGRHGDEGPRHRVTISQGLWLAETPCTQALWTAVMGRDANRSQFVDPLRPVEQVRFYDVMGFLERVEEVAPGLALRLPTEAEWEYACRADTKTATYAGPIEILGENNAPVLDAIAWYGGNSGVGFDLEEGADSSDWEEKQYPHTTAGTRKVMTRRRNPWGLYDTLGNVFEWCADGVGGSFTYRQYPDEPETDPVQPGAQRPYRVVRGGSWSGFAQHCRAASRDANLRGDRGGGLGFRFARGRA